MKIGGENLIFAFLFILTSQFVVRGDVTLYETLWSSVECDCNRLSNLDVSEVQLHVYNYGPQGAEDASYFLHDAAAAILTRPDFDPRQCIDIFVQGFNNTVHDNRAETARCVHSQITCNGQGTMGIIVDSSAYTSGGSDLTDLPVTYKRSVLYAKSIGQALGEFIVKLLSKVKIGNINISGHGLGAHIMGYAAEVVRDQVYPLPVIYALDPTGACFEDCPFEHVRSGQADLVVTTHCTTVVGSEIDAADFDFYANNGETQNGCALLKDPFGEESVSCSHYQCVPVGLSPAVVSTIWKAKSCDSYNDFIEGNCDFHESTLAGYRRLPTSSPGKYYFDTPVDPICEFQT